MSTKFVVAYDGSDCAKRALSFAKDRAELVGASLVLAYVLEWSPYSFLTPQELEERHGRRKEELSRAEEAIIKPALAELGADNVTSIIKYGNITDTLNAIVEEQGASQLFVGRAGESLSSRVFGTNAGKLAQSANVPCTIVP